ncbi:hypothetical protein [Pontibacillus sp. HMF3514]|uniref:hypothetical protein n=1 Tax=Pontibacillus sp. HMF3514 TaxID=2692425 RepID=UPI00131FBD37|nr:hypothetical protein [Pontibacillus sp. HMF3514]QHE51487.1 hypothetical protein GS400_05320 [Pontibacillus sp. HMF3514]
MKRLSILIAFMPVLISECSEGKAKESVLDALTEIKEYEAIFHHEKVKNGVVVFYEPKSDGSNGPSPLSTTFIQETSDGWESTLDRGGHTKTSRPFTSHQLLVQADENSPFPMLYGNVTNPDVKHVRITLGDKKIRPKTIHSQGNHIWYAFVDKPTDSSPFIIKGLSEDFEVVETVEHKVGQSSFAGDEVVDDE